jgi:hypothetical protein
MRSGPSSARDFVSRYHLSRHLIGILPLPTRPGGPHGQTESGGRAIAVNAGARAPRGGVTRQGVVLTDLKSLRDCQ